jgi:hypothetical protein
MAKAGTTTMIGVGRVLRWAGAVVVGFAAYILAFALAYLMWRKFGGDPEDASRWILAIATCCAVLAGAFVVPRGDGKAAALALWTLALLFPVALIVKNTAAGAFTTMNLFELAATLFGGLPAYYVMRIAPR